MWRPAIPLLAVLLFLNPLTASHSSADPVRIQSGFLFLNEDPVTSFGLDFAFSGEGVSFLGEDFRLGHFAGFSPSDPPFRLRFSDVLVAGDNTCSGCTFLGDFLFQYAPTSTGHTAAFSMTGMLTGFRGGSPDPAVRAEFVGSGRMSPAERSVLFQFAAPAAAPVPEPSTLLLVGSGVALAARRRLRKLASGPIPK